MKSHNFLGKNIHEKYLLVAGLTAGSSLLYGVLYQYGILHYFELPFFSITQALNDSIKIFPGILASFVGISIGSIFSLWVMSTRRYRELPLICKIGIIVLTWLGSFWAGYTNAQKPDWYIMLLQNNLNIILISLVVNFIGILPLAFTFARLLEKTTDNQKRNIFVVVVLISSLINSCTILYGSLKVANTTTCVIHGGKASAFRYANDKFVFVDIRPNGLSPGDTRSFSDIFPINEASFMASLKSCDAFNNALVRYFKKDGECIKMNGYSANLEYLYSDSGMVKNNNYDLYFSGACIADQFQPVQERINRGNKAHKN